MTQNVGLDVSLKETKLHVLDEVTWCDSDRPWRSHHKHSRMERWPRNTCRSCSHNLSLGPAAAVGYDFFFCCPLRGPGPPALRHFFFIDEFDAHGLSHPVSGR